MNKYKDFEQELRKCLAQDQILVDEPMRNHTNFKLGGPADLLVIPRTEEELLCVLDKARRGNIPCQVLGKGSNVIIKDGGVRGLVVKLEGLTHLSVDGDLITAGSGIELKDLSQVALEHSLTGLEFACGIPGSLGGAVFMNAGAYDGEMSFVLESVRIINAQGEIKELKKEELELGYRTSVVKTKGGIVLEAKMRLKKGDPVAIKARIDELTQRREDKQPLEYPSAGSTFKRPPGQFAGKLIQDAGLKGYEHNGAAVSDKHSGFVINKSRECRTANVLELISYVQGEVKRQFDIDLETEVLILGEDLEEKK